MRNQVIRHPLFNAKSIANNVLLVKLSSPAEYTARVSPVCLAASSHGFSAGYKCVTTGWGYTNPITEQLPNKLQQVSLPLISNRECRTFWDKKILSTSMCAGAAGASSCVYDSGGPLVCLKNGIWTLLGIVSLGTNSCCTSTPVLYTYVPSIQAWVNNMIARN
ncbi:hypothetical protein FKM82_003527 [Ascaphus truei]